MTEVQLTEWGTKDNHWKTGILFAERQLQKYGAKEGKDYIWKDRGEQFAIFNLK